jgi:hypothetical protein
MALRDLADFYVETYDIPIRGKVYRIESPSIDTGMMATRLMDLMIAVSRGEEVPAKDRAALVLDDDEELELFQRIVGPAVWEQMRADGVRFAEARHVSLTVMYWVTLGRDAADAHWESVAAPKAPPKQPQDRKPKTTRTTRAALPASDAGRSPSDQPSTPMATGGTSSDTGPSS